jgi:hypothetical protein
LALITKIEFLGWGQFADDPELHTKAREFISHEMMMVNKRSFFVVK